MDGYDDPGPPKYNEAIRMEATDFNFRSILECPVDEEPGPSAPLLSGALLEMPGLEAMAREIPSLIKFQTGPVTELTTSRYEFYVRDPSDSLLFKGTVQKDAGLMKLQCLNGRFFLGISSNSETHKVLHGNMILGIFNMRPGSPNSVRISRTIENRNYVINVLGPTDIVVCRENTMKILCKIHIPEPPPATLNPDEPFEASVGFPDLNMTTVEKCLCLSVPIAFIVARNKNRNLVTQSKAEANSGKVACVCIAIIIVIIGMTVLMYCGWGYKERKRQGNHGWCG